MNIENTEREQIENAVSPATVEIVGVRFKDAGKVYYFAPRGIQVKEGDCVIVETARGTEYGFVSSGNQMVSATKIIPPLRPILRIAGDADRERYEANKKLEEEAFVICKKKIEDHGLEMKLLEAEYTFDNSKLLFYYSAEMRVDFRELVKDLASVFRTRIELRQIGIRDEAKMLGGLGVCGRPFCCSTFLSDFMQVSIKMAKEQNLSLNSSKISGTCGRLMCCLKYEQEAYLDLLRTTPKVNAVVSTPDGKGVVIDQNLLTGKLTVRLDKSPDAAPSVYKVKDVRVLKDGQIKLNKKEIEEFKKLEN